MTEKSPERMAVTVPEAARRLSVSTATVWRLLDRGDLARVRIGRAVRVPVESIDALMRGAREGVRDAK